MFFLKLLAECRYGGRRRGHYWEATNKLGLLSLQSNGDQG